MVATNLTFQNSRNVMKLASWNMRLATDSEEDRHFLTSMCYVSVFPMRHYPFSLWDEKVILRLPQIHPWRSEWGRLGDIALLAIDTNNGKPVGAIWCRLFPCTYDFVPGFLDKNVPILSLAIEPEARQRGIGRSLLEALKHLAYQQGYTALSLGVSAKNHAHLLYERVGFQDLDAQTEHGIITMSVDLHITNSSL